MRQPLRTWRTLLVAGILLLNSACAIVSYSPSEPTAKLPAKTSSEQDFLFFSYIPISRDRSGDQQEVDSPKLPAVRPSVIKGLLEKYSKFKTAIPTVSAPARGTYVTFYETLRPHPRTLWGTVNLWTLSVIPWVFDHAYEAHFDVYVDNVLKQSYRYDLHEKGVSWIGLVPLCWVNFFTTHRAEAFSVNAYQFIADAKQDGLL